MPKTPDQLKPSFETGPSPPVQKLFAVIAAKKTPACKMNDHDIFSVASPEAIKNFEGFYPTGDTSPNGKNKLTDRQEEADLLDDDMKEYTSRQPIVLPSMIKEAVEIMNKRPSISSRPIPRTVHFVQQAIKLSGSEAAYIKSLDIRNAREAKLRIAEFAEAMGKMLKAQ